MIGRKLAHYEVLEKIGSGGMGEVYLAEDTKLDRKVALKVLPPELADSDERRARFQREAKAIAALNHPNIVHVYSVEESEGVHFITMELVKGKTLAELLPKSGFSLEKFFDIAIPLAGAVAAAHQEGIVHRDLKPGNVMVTDRDGGRIKVLDFGLARTQAGWVADSDESDVPTQLKTKEGAILGTVHYMSPEQAEGKAADHCSDIFSLGIVYYELLTGNRPFEGDTSGAVLSSIIKDEPIPIRQKHSKVPRALAKLVHRCLAKEPRQRKQSALDLQHDLEELRQDLASGERDDGVVVQKRPPLVTWLALATATLALTLVVVLAYFLTAPNATRFRLANPFR